MGTICEEIYMWGLCFDGIYLQVASLYDQVSPQTKSSKYSILQQALSTY